jgi:hypothetical protein
VIEAAGVAIITAGVGLVVWLVRLEAKATRSIDDFRVLQRRLERHENNLAIHHNADFFSEFEKRIELQFTHIDQAISRLENKLEIVIEHKRTEL